MIVFRAAGATVSPVAFGLVLTAMGFDAVFPLAGAVYLTYAVFVLSVLPASTWLSGEWVVPAMDRASGDSADGVASRSKQ